MDRRSLLTTLGAAAAASAGCLSTADGSDETPTGTDRAIPTATDGFDGYPCPTVAETDRRVCHHTASEADDVVMAADPTVFDPAGASAGERVAFTLYNRSEWAVNTNPYDWELYRFDDDAWTDVTPERPIPQPLYVLEPGGQLHWELGASYEQVADGHSAVDVSLQAGLYAFGVTGTYSGTNRTETPTGDPPVETAFLALCELESALVGDPETAT